jgi:hypothetical protein
MPISVLCSNCKARFSVSEKFAGKKGPCPKCKTVLTVPELPKEDVQIHVPEEFASGGKDAKGRPVLKPERRKIMKVKPLQVAAIIGAIVLIIGGALGLKYAKLANDLLVPALGLSLVSPLLTAAPYAFLRNDELEPYRGKELWLRSLGCAAGYLLLWGVYVELKAYDLVSDEMIYVAILLAVFAAIGGALAMGLFELEYIMGVIHYIFFAVSSLLLRWFVGWPPIWKTK